MGFHGRQRETRNVGVGNARLHGDATCESSEARSENHSGIRLPAEATSYNVRRTLDLLERVRTVEHQLTIARERSAGGHNLPYSFTSESSHAGVGCAERLGSSVLGPE